MKYKKLSLSFFAVFIVMFFSAFIPVSAQIGGRQLPEGIPSPLGFVSDYAGVISASDKQVIEAIASQVQQKSGAEIAVLTVKSFEPYGSIEEFATETTTAWGIGEKGKDNGVLIVLSTGERKTRIEVGYGLEGAIPDGLAGEIMDKYMLPFFRNNDFSSGLENGFLAVSMVVAKEYNFELEGGYIAENAKAPRKSNNNIGFFVFLIVFLLTGGRIFWPLMFLSAASGAGRHRYGSGGFGGGGFGGFGGGGFGGGGASRGF